MSLTQAERDTIRDQTHWARDRIARERRPTGPVQVGTIPVITEAATASAIESPVLCPSCSAPLVVEQRGRYTYAHRCACEQSDPLLRIFGGLDPNREVARRIAEGYLAKATERPDDRQGGARRRGTTAPEVIETWMADRKGWLCLCGPSNKGKTFFCLHAAVRLARQGVPVRLVTEEALVCAHLHRRSQDQVKRWWSDSLLASVALPTGGVLLLDDLGRVGGQDSAVATEAVQETLDRARVSGALVLATSNGSAATLPRVRGDRIAGWLLGMGRIAEVV